MSTLFRCEGANKVTRYSEMLLCNLGEFKMDFKIGTISFFTLLLCIMVGEAKILKVFNKHIYFY